MKTFLRTMRPLRAALLLPAVLLLPSACAVRLGGGGDRVFDAVAIQPAANVPASDVAARLRAAGADLVLLSADRDSAWFAAVAAESNLVLSGPGLSSGRGFAFLGNLELLGDTSIIMEVPGGGTIHMHDALYRVDANRNVDMMLVRLDAEDLSAAVAALFNYIAYDVPADAAVLLAIDAATPELAESAAVLMRAYYASAMDCPGADTSAAALGSIRLLYGPSARISCRAARGVDGIAGVHATVVVAR
jgi:hypothetical protein